MSPEEQARLDEIRVREKAATPGPWTPNVESDPPHCGDFCITVPVQSHATIFLNDTPGPNAAAFEWTANACDERARADILFIAASREDIPWLLALVDAQAESLTLARETAERFRQSMYAVEGHRTEQAARAESAENALAVEHTRREALEEWGLEQMRRAENAEARVAELEKELCATERTATDQRERANLAEREKFNAIAEYSKRLADEQTLRHEDQRKIVDLQSTIDELCEDCQERCPHARKLRAKETP